LPVLRAPGSGIRRAARTVLAAPNDLVACLVVVALCVAVGLPTIRPDNYFLGDDFGLVHHLHDLPPVRFLSYFYSDWTEGIYGARLDELRPFPAFTYWLDNHLFGAVNAQATTQPTSSSTRSTACWSGRLCARSRRATRLVRSWRLRCSRSHQAKPSP
jgi:hypothetical protein